MTVPARLLDFDVDFPEPAPKPSLDQIEAAMDRAQRGQLTADDLPLLNLIAATVTSGLGSFITDLLAMFGDVPFLDVTGAIAESLSDIPTLISQIVDEGD